MAFDLQNQEIEQLLSVLSGGQYGNQLIQPSMQNMPVSPAQQQPQPPQPDMMQQMQQQQALDPQMAMQMANQPQAQQQLGQNMPDDFAGMGLGNTAPKVQQGQPDLQQIMAMLQQQGMGGF